MIRHWAYIGIRKMMIILMLRILDIPGLVAIGHGLYHNAGIFHLLGLIGQIIEIPKLFIQH